MTVQWETTLQRAAQEFSWLHSPVAESQLLVRPVKEELSVLEFNELSTGQKQLYKQIQDPRRKKEWSESNRCRSILKDYSFQSSTHTKDVSEPRINHIVIAWGLSDPGQTVTGIGIDVETSSRPICPEVASRFVHLSERNLGLSSLELWTVKESVFKACAKDQQSSLKNYRVLNRDSNGISHCAGPSDLRFVSKTLFIGPWVVSLAVRIRSRPN